jgi:hypothetical protein
MKAGKESIFLFYGSFNVVVFTLEYIASNDRKLVLLCGQSSWLQIQRSRVRSSALPNFLTVMGLERGPLSLVRIIEELFQGNSSHWIGGWVHPRASLDDVEKRKFYLTRTRTPTPQSLSP